VCIVFLPNPPIAISNLPCCSSHGEVTFIKSCYFNEFHIVILMSFIAIFPLLSYGFVAYVNKNCDLKSRIRKIDTCREFLLKIQDGEFESEFNNFYIMRFYFVLVIQK
jgi:hypothetical protein